MLIVHRESDGAQYRLIRMFSEEGSASLAQRKEAVKVADLVPARLIEP